MVEAYNKVETSFKHLDAKTLQTFASSDVAGTIDQNGIVSNGSMAAVAWKGIGTVAVFNPAKGFQFSPALG